jgi:hypothetical protein
MLCFNSYLVADAYGQEVLQKLVFLLQSTGSAERARKTVTTLDVCYTLKLVCDFDADDEIFLVDCVLRLTSLQMGAPVYGFDQV